MNWNINFDGKTKLKDWWGVVRDNFLYLNDSIDKRIAEAQGINPEKHIADSADNTSAWLVTDRYLVAVPTTDGSVAYNEYAYIDGAWQLVRTGASTTFTTQVQISDTDWILENKMYKQTVACEGLLSTDNPIVDICMSDSLENNELFAEAWGCVIRVVANDNSIDLYTDGRMPKTGFSMNVKVVR